MIGSNLTALKRAVVRSSAVRYLRSVVPGDIPGFGSERPPPMQVRRIEQTETKRRLIEQHLGDEDENVLDIGCDAAVIARQLAETDRPVLGVDRYARYEGSHEYAEAAARKNKGLAVMRLAVTPENITRLPTFDVVLLFSVFHYWYREFGREAAGEMLSELSGVNKLFFSSSSLGYRYEQGDASDDHCPPFTDRDRESVVEFHEELLRSTLGEEYSIEYLDEINYSIADVAQVPSYDTEPRYVLLASQE